MPGLKEIQKNASLMMMNTHYLSTFHRPLMPDVVEVGCLHCRKAGAMPKVRKNVEIACQDTCPGFVIRFSHLVLFSGGENCKIVGSKW